MTDKQEYKILSFARNIVGRAACKALLDNCGDELTLLQKEGKVIFLTTNVRIENDTGKKRNCPICDGHMLFGTKDNCSSVLCVKCGFEEVAPCDGSNK